MICTQQVETQTGYFRCTILSHVSCWQADKHFRDKMTQGTKTERKRDEKEKKYNRQRRVSIVSSKLLFEQNKIKPAIANDCTHFGVKKKK
jgi:hypothetical protein